MKYLFFITFRYYGESEYTFETEIDADEYNNRTRIPAYFLKQKCLAHIGENIEGTGNVKILTVSYVPFQL